jgi:NodT family efflux transporter outer membrane factor (OMF) lipoprotein
MDVPAAWSVDATAARGENVARWWTDFGDPDLDRVVEEALANNYSVRAAAARVERAAAVAGVTRADGLPSLSAGLDAARRRQNFIGIDIPGAPDVITSRSNSFGVSLNASWELDLWGRIRSATSAALADLEASAADLAGLRLSIAAQTVRVWFAVIEAHEQVRLAEESVESYRASATRVRERYRRGVRTSLDLRLALSSLANSREALERRRQQLDAASRQLEILLGRYPAGSVETAFELPAVSGDVPAGIPAEVLIRRPDVFAAERRVAAAEARVSEARRAFLPRLTLTGSAGTLSDEIQDVTSGDFSVWSIAAGLAQPLFQGGRLLSNLDRSNAAADIALADYASTLLSAFEEIESALFAESNLAEREGHLVEANRQSEEALQLAERQYGSGLIDYITLLETRRQTLRSRSALVAVRRARLDARVDLHMALGGGFTLEDEWRRFLETESKPNDDINTDGGSS